MKLIVQIPCYNEAGTLAETISALQAASAALSGIDRVEILVIDDGSTDETGQVARAAGAQHVLSLGRHAGLAAAFSAGLDESLRLGADIIVNTDGDNQYSAADLPALLAPLLSGRAGIVVGDRGVAAQPGFSPLKRWLQRLGSRVVSAAAGMPVPDAASGFRAYTRESALRTVVLGAYSYTLETLIQAGAGRIPVVFVPIHARAVARPSRLMRSTAHYLLHSAAAVLRAYTMYRPLRLFLIAAGLLLAGGLALAVRYLVFFWRGEGQGHVQSVIVAALLVTGGFQALLSGILADLIASNRKMLEETLYRQRRQDAENARGEGYPL